MLVEVASGRMGGSKRSVQGGVPVKGGYPQGGGEGGRGHRPIWKGVETRSVQGDTPSII